DGSSRDGLRSRDGQARCHALACRDTRSILDPRGRAGRADLLELTGLPSQNRSQRDARPICQADRIQPWLSLRNGERSCSRRYAASCIFFDVCLAVLVYWSKSKPVLIDAWVSSGPLHWSKSKPVLIDAWVSSGPL